ncbi:MAG: hypothetical protein NTX35_20800 [Verrucomicrobia bacterium]|nr:hypothetical protein [Verrucomicrobiota bacterium]
MSLTQQIAKHPEHARAEFHTGLVKWAGIIDGIGKLLAMEPSLVSLEDKRQLLSELKTATCNAMACVNGIQVCELSAKASVKQLQTKWGWLL